MLEIADRARRIAPYDTGPAHWLRSAMGERAGEGDRLVVVIRLDGSAGEDQVDALLAQGEDLVIPTHERRRLARLGQAGALAGASLFGYLRLGAEEDIQQFLNNHDIGEIETILPGAAIALDAGSEPLYAAAPIAPEEAHAGALAGRVLFERLPILGIVDDDIGYLNERFCRRTGDGDLETRVEAVWIQRRARAGVAPSGASFVEAGPVITRAHISDMLEQIAQGRSSETQSYTRFQPRVGARRFAAVTHGTHVLDLAAGFAPDAAPDIPIFAVDMPGHALSAPGSRRGTSYLIQGIRWLIEAALAHCDARNAEAIAADDGQTPVTLCVPDIVLTCSIGSYAGPKDGTGLFARLIGEELDRVNAMRTPEALGGQGYHARATLFQSFGNAYALNQSARHQEQTRAGPIDWHIPRADTAASLLELRISGAKLTTLWLRMGGQDFEIKPLQQGQCRQISKNGQPVLRIYRESNEAGGRKLYSILVRPTAAEGAADFETAPAGPIRLVVDTDGPADVTWQVERDDVPFGYSGEGAQSWLGDPLSKGWDSVSRSFAAPQDGSAVLREGSETAQAHSPHPSIVTVGAAWADDAAYPPQPSSYSAAGSTDPAISMRAGPDVSATGDEAAGHPGVLATGTLSGSVARLAGTSVAAPQAARRMLLTGLPPEPTAPLSTRTGPRFEDRSGARDARLAP